ncbi:MAG: hypothetical protein JWL80_118 [Parcubacteria group bacterium]|nr:hypothetical protein [Parcubacteria group bacterium]
MSFESGPTPEQERAVIAEALKTKGIEDPETGELLIAWTEKKEAETFADGSVTAQVQFEIERGKLFIEAGPTPAFQANALSSFRRGLYEAEGAKYSAMDLAEKTSDPEEKEKLLAGVKQLAELEDSVDAEYGSCIEQIDALGETEDEKYTVWESIAEELLLDDSNAWLGVFYLNGLRHRSVRLQRSDMLEKYTKMIEEAGGELEELRGEIDSK